MRLYIIGLVFLAFFTANGQEGIFEYQVTHPSKDVYELAFQFYEAVEVQFIRVNLYDDQNLMGSHEAILNKKADNNYYLFFEGKEELVYMDQLTLVINNPYGKLKVEHQYIEVQLLDKEMQPIDTYRKEVY